MLNLSISKSSWSSPEIKLINSSERVALSMERACSLSKSECSKILSTSISDDMHGVDDVLFKSKSLGSHFLFSSISV